MVTWNSLGPPRLKSSSTVREFTEPVWPCSAATLADVATKSPSHCVKTARKTISLNHGSRGSPWDALRSITSAINHGTEQLRG